MLTIAVQVGTSRLYKGEISFQINSVDNEFSQSPASHAAYFSQLEEVYHRSSIDVPLTYNDPGMGSSFINGTVGLIPHPFPASHPVPFRAGCSRSLWVCFLRLVVDLLLIMPSQF